MKLNLTQYKNFIKKYSLFILFFIIFIGIFLLNHYTPLLIDDYNLQYMYGDATTKVDSVNRILKTLSIYYFQRGGRILPQILEQILLLMPKTIFNILDSIVFLLMIFAIYLNINIKNLKNKFIHIFFIILFLFWFGIPRFGETVMWQNGAVTYMWTSVLLLYFIYFVKKFVSTQNFPVEKKAIYVLILSFFAGWTVELGVAGVFIGIIIYLIPFLKKKQIPFFIYKMLFLFCAGAFFLVIAPGNYSRSGKILIDTKYDGTLGEILSSSISSMKINLSNRLAMYDKTPHYFAFLRELFSITSLLWIVLIISIIILLLKKVNIKNIMLENYSWLCIFIFGVAFYYMAPYFPMRGIFIPVIFLIIFVTNIFLEALNLFKTKYLFAYVSIIFSVLILFSYFPLLANYKIENMVAGHIKTLDKKGQDEMGKCAGYSYDGWILPFIMETTAKETLFSNFSKKYYNKNIQTRVYTIFLTRNLYFRSGDCGADNFWTPTEKPIFEL